MKKLFIAGIALSCLFAQSANAQSILSNLLSGVANAAASSTSTSNSSNSTTTSNILGAVANSALSTAASSNSTVSNLVNLISSVTGDVTTTAATVVGTWSYTQPSVQFESQNYLTQAGGTAIAGKVEKKLASLYKLAGIKSGKMTFVFDNSGNVTYSVGSIKRTGTYVFDATSKTITITTASGANIKTYVTVSGDNLYLTFDGSKFLTFMKTLGSKFSVLNTVSTLASTYEGMKVGFTFAKK